MGNVGITANTNTNMIVYYPYAITRDCSLILKRASGFEIILLMVALIAWYEACKKIILEYLQ